MPIDAGVVRLRLSLDKKNLLRETAQAARQSADRLKGLNAVYQQQTRNIGAAANSQRQLIRNSQDLNKTERLKLLEQHKQLAAAKQAYAQAQRVLKIEQAVEKAKQGASIAQRKALRETKTEMLRVARLAGQIEKTNLEAGFKRAQKEIKGMSMGLRAAQGAAKGLGLALKGALVGSGVGVALAGLSALSKLGKMTIGAPFAAIGGYNELNATLSMLGSVTGKSLEELAPLQAEIKAVGGSSTKTANEVAELAVAYSRLGFSAEDTKSSLAAVVAINEAGGSLAPLEETSKQVGGIIDSYGLAADQAKRVGEILVTTANSSATDLASLGDSFDRVRGSASSFSQTVESTATALGVFASQGDVTAERAAESYNQALVKIKGGAAEIEKIFKVDVFDVETGNMRQITDIAKELSLVLGDLNDKDMAKALSSFIPDERAQKSVVKLIKGFDEANEKTQMLEKNLANSAGSLDAAVERFRSSNKAKLLIIQSALDATSISFAESMQPATQAVLGAFGDIAQEIAANTGLFDELNQTAEEFAISLRQNPELVEAIADNIQDLISKGLEVAVHQAERLIDWLDDPDAVDDLIQGMNSFNEGLKGAVEITGQLISALQRAAQTIGPLVQGVKFFTGVTAGNQIGKPLGNALGGGINRLLGRKQGQGTEIKVARTGEVDEEGLEVLRMDLVDKVSGEIIDTVLGNSGIASTQNFTAQTSRNAFPGSNAPIPTGNFDIGQTTSSPDDGIQGWFVPLEGGGDNQQGRGAFGIHMDANRVRSPGSAGCIVLYDPAAKERVKAWLEDKNAPRQLSVDYSVVPISAGGNGPASSILANSLAMAGAPSTAEMQAGNATASSSGDLGYFAGGTNSFIARAIGTSEGTRTPDGGFTQYYQGHKDPGNGAWNMGSFSAQGEGWSSPEQADEAWVNRLEREYMPKFVAAASKVGLENNEAVLLNFLDLVVQSPLAATGAGGFLDQLGSIASRGGSNDAILDARAQSYIDPSTGMLNAPGLGNNMSQVRADQSRRMQALASVSGGGSGLSPMTGSQLDAILAESDDSAQREAEREAQRLRQEALNAAKEARAAAIAVRSETDKTADMLRDEEIRQSRAAEDLAIATARAASPNSDAVEAVAARAEDRLQAYRAISDEIERNNRAARDLNQAIADERSNASIEEPVNEGVIAQYQLQLEQLGKSNDLLREQRQQELELLDLKYEQVSAEERLTAQRERTAQLTELQRQGRSLESQLAIAREDNPLKVMRLELEEELSAIDDRYADTFDELRQKLERLTSDSAALTELAGLDSAAQDELDEVNRELGHTSALLTELGNNKGLEQALAGTDLARFEAERRNEFLEELRDRARDADVTLAERDGGEYGRRAFERERGATEILGRSVAGMQQARDMFGANSPEFNEAAETLQRIADADLTDLIAQTRTLGEELGAALGSEIDSALEGLITGAKSLNEAFVDVLSSMASMLAQAAISGLFGGGGFSGLLGGLFAADGHIPGTGIQAKAAYGGYIPNAADGNMGGLIEAAIREGERKPAGAGLLVANTSEAVLNQGQQRALVSTLQSNRSAGGINSNVSVNVTNHGGGQDKASAGNMGREIEGAVLAIVERHARKGKRLGFMAG